MSDDGEQTLPRGSVDFVDSSILDTIIPSSTSMNMEEALSGSVERLDVASGSPLSAIAQRESLFFGKPCSDINGSMSYLFTDPR
jgi:hypothetical protein